MTQTLPIQSPAPSLKERLAFLSQIGPVLGLIGIVIFFSIRRPATFASLGNAQIVLQQTSIVGTAALGATIVIVSSGIDLSVGSVVGLTSMAAAMFLQWKWTPLAAAPAAILVGCAAGLLNGLLITQLRLMPFIVTLGTLAAYRGLTERLGNDQGIDAPSTWLNRLVHPPTEAWMLVAPGVWVMIVLTIVVALALRYTRAGRHIYAVGSNEQTARLCGVRVDRSKLIVYTLGGLFAGVAGVLAFSKLGVGVVDTGSGLELDVIAAVVLGGASLNGGQGSVFGTLVGALIMSVIANGCAKLGMRSSNQKMLTGGIIILAVAIDRLQHRRRAV